MSNMLTGSICVSDIPKDLIKWVVCRDGVKRGYLNICIMERKEPKQLGNKVVTHFVSCAPPKNERVDGVNYFIGDLTERTDSNVANQKSNNDLPF